MNRKTRYLIFLISLYSIFSSQAQITLKEGNPTKNIGKFVEVMAHIPQRHIKLIKGQKLKISNIQDTEEAKLVLSDLSGKVVLQEQIFAYNPVSSEIDLNSGTYFLTVRINENNPVKSILVVN